jgi:hypothetical protein
MDLWHNGRERGREFPLSCSLRHVAEKGKTPRA